MDDNRIHRTTSFDGTEIAGRVTGEGPALVLVHGGIGSGEVNWSALLPHLTDRFTCYLMSTRGLGLSSPSDDMTPERLIEDVAAFADSIGEPVALLGQSSGSALSLGAATRAEHIRALALAEPVALELRDQEEMERALDAAARMGEEAAEGRLSEAAQIFIEDIGLANDEDLADPRMPDWYEIWGPSVPTVLAAVANFIAFQPTDPSLLDQVQVPVMLQHGDRTHPSYTAAVRRIAEALPDVQEREVPGVGHLAPQLAAPLVAEEFVSFLAANFARV
jgi:pimeloyl-ACP methyl ester carboxylesterase